MHTWNGVAADLQLQVGPRKPHPFIADLTFVDGNQQSVLQGAEQTDGSVLYDVTAQQVAAMIDGQAFLFLVTSHTLNVGAADNRWGWRYALFQNGAPLSGTSDNGSALMLDPAGFFNSGLFAFGASQQAFSRKAIIVK